MPAIKLKTNSGYSDGIGKPFFKGKVYQVDDDRWATLKATGMFDLAAGAPPEDTATAKAQALVERLAADPSALERIERLLEIGEAMGAAPAPSEPAAAKKAPAKKAAPKKSSASAAAAKSLVELDP
ncbi:MAG: hypothetical protein ACPGQD_04360 [Planctomycetota bacterium]